MKPGHRSPGVFVGAPGSSFRAVAAACNDPSWPQKVSRVVFPCLDSFGLLSRLQLSP